MICCGCGYCTSCDWSMSMSIQEDLGYFLLSNMIHHIEADTNHILLRARI